MNEENKIPPGEIPQEPEKIVHEEETIRLVEPATEANNEMPETTLHQQTTPDNMEVHHHTHAAHGKKTWKNYFWEFLMLFLAVFCGFLAEYQLEHVIENQREKIFVKSMIEDLQEDHRKLSLYGDKLKLGLQQMDSMVTILADNNLVKQNGNLVYYFGRISPRLDAFDNNNRTFEQLKNSGSFRLIRKAAAANKIMSYYSNIGFIRHLETLYFQEFNEYKKIASKVFEPGVFRSMEMPDGNISREANNPALRTSNIDLLKELAVFAVYMNGSRRSLIPAAENLKKNGEQLISYLKKEYHLD